MVMRYIVHRCITPGAFIFTKRTVKIIFKNIAIARAFENLNIMYQCEKVILEDQCKSMPHYYQNLNL